MRWAKHVTRVEQRSNTCTVLVVKAGRKRQLRRASPRWDNTIRGFYKKWQCVDWVRLA